MAIQTFRARVAEHTLLASKFQYVHFELINPARIEFLAGQYLLMKIPGEVTPRQYSIASPPSMNHAVEILVDVSPQGIGSVYLAALAPGDEVEFMAPAGKFAIADDAEGAENAEKELWFVATGSGISAIRAMIVNLLVDKKDKRPMWLHWGLRYGEDVFWFSEFAESAEEYDNFTFDMVLSKPPEGWQLCQGHVTECVLKHHGKGEMGRLDFAKIGAYLCGNKVMIKEMKKVLTEKGVPGERVHSEQFF